LKSNLTPLRNHLASQDKIWIWQYWNDSQVENPCREWFPNEPEFQLEFQTLWEELWIELKHQKITYQEDSDKLHWSDTLTSNFSIKKDYNLLASQQNCTPQHSWQQI
jgi:hypothetical protein